MHEFYNILFIVIVVVGVIALWAIAYGLGRKKAKAEKEEAAKALAAFQSGNFHRFNSPIIRK